MYQAQIVGELDMTGAKVAGTLNMDFIRHRQPSIHARRHRAQRRDPGGRADRRPELDMTGTKVTGELNMDAASISSDLFMREGAEFKDLILHDAHIGGQLDMTDAKVAGTLNLDAASIGGDLYMRDGAEFMDVILRGAHLRLEVELLGAKTRVAGTLRMDGASIGGSLFMRRGRRVQGRDPDRRAHRWPA